MYFLGFFSSPNNCFIAGSYIFVSAWSIFVHKGAFEQTISIEELEADVINEFHMTQQILLKFNSLQQYSSSTSELNGPILVMHKFEEMVPSTRKKIPNTLSQQMEREPEH